MDLFTKHTYAPAPSKQERDRGLQQQQPQDRVSALAPTRPDHIAPLDPHTSSIVRSSLLIPSLPHLIIELARNALDAGATNIDVWLKFECDTDLDLGTSPQHSALNNSSRSGGRRRRQRRQDQVSVRVQDDGKGIGVKDMQRVAERFVTGGDIRQGREDYEYGYGYRGESLASIASLGLLEITSRTSLARSATTKIIKHSKTIYCGPARSSTHLDRGTIVTVRDIFSALPVRRAALSSLHRSTFPDDIKLPSPIPSSSFSFSFNSTSTATLSRINNLWNECQRAVEQIALVSPGIRWIMWDESKKSQRHHQHSNSLRRILDLRGDSILDVFRKLYGNEIASAAVEVRASSGSRAIRGFVSLDGSVSRSHQHLFINGRSISGIDLHNVVSRRISAAIRLTSNKRERNPVYVLDIKIPTSGPGRDIISCAFDGKTQNFVISVLNELLRRHDRSTPPPSSPKPSSSLTPRKKDKNISDQHILSQSSTTRGIVSRDGINIPTTPRRVKRMTCEAGKTPRSPIGEGFQEVMALQSSRLKEDGLFTDETCQHGTEWIDEIKANIPDTLLPKERNYESQGQQQTRKDNIEICISRKALQTAQILGQVDRKFVCCIVDTNQEDDRHLHEHEHYQKGKLNGSTNWDHRQGRFKQPTVVLIDQHAADERVEYEQLLVSFAENFITGQPAVTELKEPVVVIVSGGVAMNVILLAIEVLKRWGISCTLPTSTKIQVSTGYDGEFQPKESQVVNTIARSSASTIEICVTGVPTSLANRLKKFREEIEEIVRGCLEDVSQREGEYRIMVRMIPVKDLVDINGSIENRHSDSLVDEWVVLRCLPRMMNELAKSKACRSAIMFGDKLSKDQCERLVNRLSDSRIPFTCAHGRPSVVPLMNVGLSTNQNFGDPDRDVGLNDVVGEKKKWEEKVVARRTIDWFQWNEKKKKCINKFPERYDSLIQ